jgi:lipoate-protein ligase A
MAIDESLLSCFNSDNSVPILRIYGWNPPSLSLGRFQLAHDALDMERCRADSLAIVRRISGGGAIYHSDELTYSVICSPEQVPEASSVKDSFRILTGFLLDFYKAVGLGASYAIDSVADGERLGVRTAFCFAGKESFDILIEGKKIGGNAQRRQKNVIFQHGSIPLENRARIGLEYMSERTPGYAENTTSLGDLGVSADVNHLKRMLVDSFSFRMGTDLFESTLSREELHLSEQLLEEKYIKDSWNLRGEIV